MLGLSACEDAAISNDKARYWLDKIANKVPTTDSAYFDIINASPWCYVVSDGNKHNTVYQYNADFTASANGIIHKKGEAQWIKNNFSKIKRLCTTPFDIYNGGTRILSYRNPVSAKACMVFMSPTSRDSLLHSEGRAGTAPWK